MLKLCCNVSGLVATTRVGANVLGHRGWATVRRARNAALRIPGGGGDLDTVMKIEHIVGVSDGWERDLDTSMKTEKRTYWVFLDF
jgi:hypothetical protein